ncbi:MAG TPA: hypothetical protein VNG33_18960 [Polyangiaceae bacterium]|nr:hypothetical protein [Polyangiaceae bacterium]
MKGPATTTLVERPPAGPARGIVPAPAWLVGVVSVALVCLAGLILTRAWRRRAK